MKAIEVVPEALKYSIIWWPSFGMWIKFQVFLSKIYVMVEFAYWLSYNVIEESLSHCDNSIITLYKSL